MAASYPPDHGSLLAVSDLHVSHRGNRPVVEAIRPRHEDDWLIVAGDVSDTVADLQWTLKLLKDRFRTVIWAPGNHELWTPPHEELKLRGDDRYRHLVEVSRELGVITPEDPYPVWTNPEDGEELVVAPLFLLYDYSWRPEGMTLPEALAYARETRVVCTDEFFLHPDPYPTRQDWAEARLLTTEARLADIPADRRTVLVSHWPLHRAPTTILRWPHFAMWCGMDRTTDWHRRFRAAAAVYGHLHIPLTISVDGVRFEEVSLGYPREWKDRTPNPPRPVRSIFPADPERKPIGHTKLKAWAAARMAQHAAERAAGAVASKLTGAEKTRKGRERLYRMNP
ncbi:metallophosphoesterase family protein [Spongisporangium articulatum]|uniref:Metallophosphoesterase family protein n=1 Tax=Spongisporangium articulatum TaxID=3362603 RepID=A0ABW8ARN8_9ACTN